MKEEEKRIEKMKTKIKMKKKKKEHHKLESLRTKDDDTPFYWQRSKAEVMKMALNSVNDNWIKKNMEI